MSSLSRKVNLRRAAAAQAATARVASVVGRTGQVVRSTVPVGDDDVSVVDGVGAAVEVAEDLPVVVDTADVAASDAYDASMNVGVALAEALQAAQDAADALTTANGKNSRRRGVTEPAPPEGGWVQGDQWVRDEDRDGVLVPVQVLVWNGTEFVPEQIIADDILVIGEDGTVRIKDDTVTAGAIAANAIDGKTITGATVRTAESGQRWIIDQSGIRGFDGGNIERVVLLPAEGGMRLGGSIGSAEDSISAYIGRNVVAFDRIVGGIPASPVASYGRSHWSLWRDPETTGESAISDAQSSSSRISFHRGENVNPEDNQSAVLGTSYNGPDLTLIYPHASQPSYARLQAGQGRSSLQVDRITSAPNEGTTSNTPIEIGSPATFPGNTFALKSQLDAWAPIDGTHAWVTAEGREYVRAGGAWCVAFEDTGWIRLDGWTGGFEHSSAPVYYRRRNGYVELRGSLTNSSWAGGLTSFGASLPVGFRPTQTAIQTLPVNSTITRSAEFNGAGQIRLYGSVASGAWWVFDMVRFPVAS